MCFDEADSSKLTCRSTDPHLAFAECAADILWKGRVIQAQDDLT